MRTSLLEIVKLVQWYLMSLHEWQYICQTLHLIIEFTVKLVQYVTCSMWHTVCRIYWELKNWSKNTLKMVSSVIPRKTLIMKQFWIENLKIRFDNQCAPIEANFLQVSNFYANKALGYTYGLHRCLSRLQFLNLSTS